MKVRLSIEVKPFFRWRKLGYIEGGLPLRALRMMLRNQEENFSAQEDTGGSPGADRSAPTGEEVIQPDRERDEGEPSDHREGAEGSGVDPDAWHTIDEHSGVRLDGPFLRVPRGTRFDVTDLTLYPPGERSAGERGGVDPAEAAAHAHGAFLAGGTINEPRSRKRH